MTLKEKLRQELTGHLSDEKTEVDINIAATIAEEFAIEFAEWCDNNFFRMGNTYFWAKSMDWDNDTKFTTKELLEIYKQKKDYAKCEYCNLENGNHKLSCPVIKVTMIL